MNEIIKVIFDRDDIVAMADHIRTQTNTTSPLTFKELNEGFLSIGGIKLPELDEPATEDEVFLSQEYIDAQGKKKTGTFTLDTELNSQDTLIAQIQSALHGKAAGGGGVEGGLDTSDATATSRDILAGETAYARGIKLIGTMPDNGTITSVIDGITTKSITIPEGYTTGGSVSLDDTIDNEVVEQTDLIAQIQSVVDNLPEAGSGKVTLQDKTVTPTASIQTVTADTGYSGLDTVTVNAIPSTYVQPTSTKGATTYTPGVTDQTIAAGTYLTGVQTILGDANLVASNIVSGKTIFGVAGTATAGESGGTTPNYEDEILSDTIVEYTNSTVTKLKNYAFFGANNLTSINMPACTTIGAVAFSGCTSLKTAIFENCTSIASSAFYGCTKLSNLSFPVCKSVYYRGFTNCTSLVTANFPSCTYIGGYAFQGCTKLANLSLPLCRTMYSSTFQSCKALTTVSLPAITTIGSTAFGSCTNLTTFYLMGSTVCALSNSNAFTGTGITSSTGSIYVPASLVTSYQTATNWTYFSTQFVGI